MNHIAEYCAELALYRVMISVDEILDHYRSEQEIDAMDKELAGFLNNLHTSPILKSHARKA